MGSFSDDLWNWAPWTKQRSQPVGILPAQLGPMNIIRHPVSGGHSFRVINGVYSLIFVRYLYS
jgi:hypothetical protein